jgi:serine/threonine protein kinase/tetratricopeptide (TPR) repeat protein
MNQRSLSPPAARASPTDIGDPLMAEAARLADLLAASWHKGLCCSAEELLAEHPDIAQQPRAAVRVIYEEICQRQERGQEVSLAELGGRFPLWQEELAVVLNCHQILDLAPAGPRFPEVGDILGEFRLLTELGRGAMGRVYLGEQTFLAGRLMIVKVTPCGNQEHLNLARLQHTHIVPLYSVRDFPERHLRQLCMPCLGGATIQQILQQLRDVPQERRTGRALLAALQASVPDPRVYWQSQGSSRRFLDKASYVQAVCWIGVCLAEALHYAHEQGLVHLDVKPSNVLLTADCQPMLLDFHLAREPIRPHGAEPLWLGGTPAYMSPEQLAAWRACRDRQPIAVPVDERSDVYALGLLLREMLYGYDPGAEPGCPGTSLSPRTDVSVGLRDILGRCLRDIPDDRYPSAQLLAEDLRRHLTHRPLIGVRNRALAERWRKWRHRRPHALLLSLLIAVCVGATVTFASLYAVQASRHRHEAEAALGQGLRQFEQRQFAEAVRTFEHALNELGGTADDPLCVELLRCRRRAARAHDVSALHQWVEHSRYLHGDDLLAPATLRTLEAQCQMAWDQRERLLDPEAPLDAETEENLRRDLLDVAILTAECMLRLGAADSDRVRRDALPIMLEAEAMFGASPVLSRLLQQIAFAPSRPTPPARTAWEHYTLGRWLLRAGDLDGAAAAFDQAVELRPQDFWPWFGKGRCAHRRERLDESIQAFTVCLALAPDSAACYHNRAMALTARGDAPAALRDYDRALRLDPKLAAAALNRGALHLQERRFAQAESDFRLALTLGANAAAVYYNQALVHQARQEFNAALTDLERALEHDPNHVPSRELRDRLKLQLGSNRR